MNLIQKIKVNGLKKKLQAFAQKREDGAQFDSKTEAEHFIELAQVYDKHEYDPEAPKASTYALEAYRAAAILGDPNAQYLFGQRKIEEGKFWVEMAHSFYGCEAHQQYAQQCFSEGFQYLEQAEKNNHALAYRFHGLCYINGWGLDSDTNKGFDYIIKSIDLENAWDRATKILEELGLNSQGGLQALLARRQQN